MTKLRTEHPVAPHLPAAEDRKLIVVLGMHRSGTSVITRGLQALGIDLGESLMPPAPGNNEKGFFEDAEIVALNDRVLALAGRSWHSLDPVEPELLQGPAFFSLRAEALNLLASRFRTSPVFGMKDPRLCVLMPFWMCVFEDLEITPGFVIALRNPLAAAQSLRARDDLVLEHSVALWGLHMIGAVRATSGYERVFVSFDSVFKDPLPQLNRMADVFGLAPLTQSCPEFLEYVEDFLDPSLRRQLVGERELGRAGLATSAVTDLYERLVQTALPQETGLLSNADLDVEDILLRFAELRPLLQAIDKLQLRADTARASETKLVDRLEQARLDRQVVQDAHDDACRQRDAARADAEHTHAQLAAHAHALEQARRHAEDLQAAREIVQKAHDDACAQRDAARTAAETLQLDIDALNHRLAALSETIAEYENALNLTTANLSEARARISQYESELNAARAGWQRSVREIDGERARAETLRIMAQQNAEAVRHLQESLARAQEETAKYRASTSWKLTAPIRGLSRLITSETTEQKAQRLHASQPLSKAAWKHMVGNDVPRAALPPPARDPVLRAQRGVVLQAGAPWIAVVIHAFYPELLDDILDRVARLPVQTKLYVTAPEGAVPSVTASLERQAMPFMLLETDNRGRDIAPFLSALAYVREDGAQLLLKLHTKRSPHLENGDHWRVQLLDSLLNPAAAGRALEALGADPALGVLAPDGHVLSVSAFLGANAGQVSRLSRKLGIEQESVEASVFVAGSMFYARPRIFYPLMESAICTSDFEVERGQLDGTLAHGIERLVGALTAKQGMRLSALGDLDEESLPLGRGAYRFV